MPKLVGKSTHYPFIPHSSKSEVGLPTTHYHLRPGITIVEILIGLVILSVVSLFIYYIFSSQLSLFVQQITGIGVSSQNKIALEDITNQTRQAESIVTTCPNPPCAPTEVGTTSTSVVYRLWGLDVNSNPTNSYYDYVVIKQEGTNMKRIVYKNASSSRQASDDIIATDLDPTSGLTFSYNNASVTLANQVTATVKTTKTEGAKTQTIAQSTSAKIRNRPTSLPPKSAPQVTIVDPNAPTGGTRDTSIAIGADTYPVVAYGGNLAAKVAKCVNKECTGSSTLTTIASGSPDNTGGIAIAVPSDGLPAVAFYGLGAAGLRMTKCGIPSCSSGNTTQSLDSTSGSGDGVSVAIGSDNLPIISYHDDTNNKLKAFKCGNPDCTSGNISSIVDNGLNPGKYSSIAIGNDNLPVISYEETTGSPNSLIKVAKCASTSCNSTSSITTVYTSTGLIQGQTDIAIGADGNPVVVYGEGSGTPGRVMLTKCGNPSCSSGNNNYPLLNTRNQVYNDPSVTIMEGLPTISSQRGIVQQDNGTSYIPEVMIVTQCTNTNCSAGSNLIFSSGPPWVNSNHGKYSSITLGSDGYPVISFDQQLFSDMYVVYDP